MTDEQIRQRVASNSIEFCAMLRSGQYGDFRKYMTPDLRGVGINGQILCVQLAANLEAEHKFIPEVSDYIEAWMSCYESGLLVEIPQVEQQQPQRGKTTAEMEGELLARELELMRAQKRQQPAPLKPENDLFQKIGQAKQNDETIQALKSDCHSAQMKVNYRNGVIDYGETNRLRTAELLRLRGEYVKKFPRLAQRIESEVNAAAAGMGLQLVPTATQRLPLDCPNSVRRTATVDQLKDLRRREQERDRKAALPREE